MASYSDPGTLDHVADRSGTGMTGAVVPGVAKELSSML
jgi:hypothetical protein